MKFLPLIWSNLRRRPLRALFTLLSILVAFILFGYLAAIDAAFGMGVDLAGADRLVMTHKVSIIQLLPQSYEARIERIEGVVDATHATWFGGIYRDPRNFFPQMPVKPDEYLAMYPEFVLPEAQKAAWLETRTGAVVGHYLADRYGFEIGDRVPIQATIWRRKDGSRTWEFDVVGIYEGAEKGTDTTQFLFRHDYFDEARAFGEGMVGWYIIRVADPERSADLAARIDEEFVNSPYETKTATEQAFVQAFANQVGNIGAIITAVLGAVFFTILLVAGNTMAQSVRERIGELAVLKTVGFGGRQVLGLVLGEAVLLAAVGGGLGLAAAWWLIGLGDPTGGLLPIFYFPPRDLLAGSGLVLLLGLAAGIFPALQAMRLPIVDALRRA